MVGEVDCHVRQQAVEGDEFAVLTDIARRSRAMAAGLPEQQEAVELWNGIGFVLAGERYVAPMGEVTEILHVPRYTHIPGVHPFMMGAANVRGRLLPLVDLAGFFEVPRSSRSTRERRVLVVEQGDVFSGLVVDSVSGMQYFAVDIATGCACKRSAVCEWRLRA